jgi:hypothetical protein
VDVPGTTVKLSPKPVGAFPFSSVHTLFFYLLKGLCFKAKVNSNTGRRTVQTVNEWLKCLRNNECTDENGNAPTGLGDSFTVVPGTSTTVKSYLLTNPDFKKCLQIMVGHINSNDSILNDSQNYFDN